MWQSIQTAPKDGTQFLMVLDGRVVLGVWYDTAWDEYNDGEEWSGWCWTELEATGNGKGGDCKDGDGPTYWMPVPSPPDRP